MDTEHMPTFRGQQIKNEQKELRDRRIRTVRKDAAYEAYE